MFAALVLLAGVGAYAMLRRQSERFGSGPLALVPTAVLALTIAVPAAQELLKAQTATHNAAEILLFRAAIKTDIQTDLAQVWPSTASS